MNIITGSGRSGTSFAAAIIDKIVGLAGEHIWENDVRAGMENKWIVDMNKMLFDHYRIERPYSNQWLRDWEIADVKECIKSGSENILSQFSAYYGKWVKDPLFSKTLKIWLDVGVSVEHLIVCTRNPHNSMISAKRSNRGFEPAAGYTEDEIELEMNARQGYLWDVILRYGLPYSIVRYEHMLQDFPIVLAKLFPENDLAYYDKLVSSNWNPRS